MLWFTNYTRQHEGYTQAGLNYLMALLTAGDANFDLASHTAIRWSDMPPWSHPLRTYRPGVTQSPVVTHLNPYDCTNATLGGAVRSAMTVFETDRLPYAIASALNETNQAIIVPAEFNRQGLIVAGYRHPIHVVPHTVSPTWWTTAPDRSTQPAFTFGYVGAWNHRKNPVAILRAYMDAFPQPRSDVQLWIKTTARPDLAEDFQATGADQRPDIFCSDAMWSETQMQQMHTNIDCFVTAHCSEGWGLGPFQAKLLGKPVIYTDWSAVLEFCSPVAGDIPVAYEMVVASPYLGGEPKLYVDNINGQLMWASPLHDSLVEALRTMAQHPTHHQQLAENAKTALQHRFCWETVGAQLRQVISELPRA
jgi:glycosyltransferase involved in cell wall biosynthesis